MTARIPMSITHDEFLEAMTPLFDRLGVSANEVVGDIHIIRADTSNFEIRFNVVAPPADAPASDNPDALPATEHPQGDAMAIWTHQIEVAVV